jgi:predicted phage terminase large subunit-like protein
MGQAALKAPPNEVWADNPELVARFFADPVLSWLARFIEWEEQYPTPEFHLDVSEMMQNERRMLVKAPRSFSKSGVCSRGYPLYLAANYGRLKKMAHPPVYPHNRVLVIGSNASHAQEHLLWVRGELESNDDIVSEYGDLSGDKWGEHHFRTCEGFELRAIGAGSKLRGFRPSLVIGDDLDDDEEVLSEDRRQKKRDWFDKVVINLMDKAKAQGFVIGTNIHPLCLLNYIEAKPGWKSKTYKAIQPDGSPLWPSKWPLAKLEERRKEIGPLAFASEFMNEPIISLNPVFEKEWFTGYDPDSEEFKQEERRGLYTIMRVDPAISKADESDYTATVTVSATPDKKGPIFIREVKRGHWSLRDSVNECFQTYDKYKQRRTIVETNAYQKALADELRAEQEMRRKMIGVMPIDDDKDKLRRAHSITPICQDGRVRFNFNDPMQQRLMDEMLLFPTGDHDDMVDALIGCLEHIRDWGAPLENKQTEPDSKPRHKYTGYR